jgi:cellulose synthase/poly-beta-1,6-N-acetylglucosamine synthase-like glycosyltransferase
MEKCAVMDWPKDKLEIQVLDDSTETETPEVVRETMEKLIAAGSCEIHHIMRTNRVDYKAGALREATPKAKGEFLALFDADFEPPKDFLLKTIPHFEGNENIGCVQTRWGHNNRDASVFTHIQALGHDGHFMIEQQGRWSGNLLFNFNGTGGVWRKTCAESSGGWLGDSLAEDLDLSYRVQMAGWKFLFLRDICCPAELPVSISAFKKQQHRWAKGSMQTAKMVIPKLWGEEGKNLTMWQKYNATVHLMGYFCHPLMLFNLFCTMCLFFLTEQTNSLPQIAVILLIAAGPPLVVTTAQFQLGHPETLLHMPFLLLLHHGLCISNSIAVFEALIGHKSAFERTPKFGTAAASKPSVWKATTYMSSVRKATGIFWEMAMALLVATVIVTGFIVTNPDPLVVPWLVFFFISFLYIAYLHIQEGDMKA